MVTPSALQFVCPQNLPTATSRSIGGVGIFFKHCFQAGKMAYLWSTRYWLCDLCENKAVLALGELPMGDC